MVKRMSNVDSTSQSIPVRTRKFDGFLLLLLVVSLALNVYLGWKLKQAPIIQPSASKPLVGKKVDPVTARGLDGKPVTITYNESNKPTVYYVMTPSCIWCRRNQGNINKIAETKANDFRFVGLSLAEEGLQQYADEHPLKFPIYTGLTEGTVRALGLGSTPQTIIVAPGGQVVKVWTGAYIDKLQPEIEAYFGTQLPGLVPLK